MYQIRRASAVNPSFIAWYSCICPKLSVKSELDITQRATAYINRKALDSITVHKEDNLV